ncbi:MAG TPA: hypothetical protein VGR26_18570 [Acidimicrobiales bacterium]|nr:hypothetical protein [Acidimicrobiales bacterium]
MGEPDSGSDKLVGDELRRFVADERSDRIGVLVEVEEPLPEVVFGMRDRCGKSLQFPVAIPGDGEDKREQLEAVAGRLASLLTQLTGEEPVWLGAGRAFSVNATAEQLRAISTSPLVRRVSRNRYLR